MNPTKTRIIGDGLIEFTIDGERYRCYWKEEDYNYSVGVKIHRLDTEKFLWFWTRKVWNHIWTDKSCNLNTWDAKKLTIDQTAKVFLTGLTTFLDNTTFNPK